MILPTSLQRNRLTCSALAHGGGGLSLQIKKTLIMNQYLQSIPVTALFKVCIGLPLTGIAGLNPAGGMDVSVFLVLCVVRYLYKKSLLLARHVFRNNSCVLGQ
jgi:hypothetical protein